LTDDDINPAEAGDSDDDVGVDDGGAPASGQRLRLSWGGATHQGQIRPVNQDALFADRGLFVVADGMGGHQAGEVASRISVKTLAGRENSTIDELVASVSAANTAVFDHASTDEQFKGMGTTLTALAVVGDGKPPKLALVNVGDSRVYRLRDGHLGQLTDDHSYVAELVRRGQISESEAETHPYRNMLTRAIGVGDTVEVDQWELEPVADDVYLLCSDGLTNEIEEDEISSILIDEPDPTEAARALITAANRSGGRDNITVVIVTVDVEEIEEVVAVPAVPATSAMDTGVIGSVASTAPETADMEGLVEGVEAELAETTQALADLEAVAVEGVDPAPVVPDLPEEVSSAAQGSTLTAESGPQNALAGFDLPQLEGEDSTLPWLTEPDSKVAAPADEQRSGDIDDAGTSAAEVFDDASATAVVDGSLTDVLKAAAAESSPDEPVSGQSAQVGGDSDQDRSDQQETTVVGAAQTTTPINPFLDPVTAGGPVDHFAPAVRGWKAPVAVTWRSLLFVSVVLAVIIAAGGLVAWYARSAYYVGYAGDEVVIYQGRPDGVLWFDPTLEETTGVFRQDLSAPVAAEVEELFETSTLDGARAFVEEIRPAPGAERAPPAPADEGEDPVAVTTTTLS
jgi:serine/threonine protein phosphatase PrpC